MDERLSETIQTMEAHITQNQVNLELLQRTVIAIEMRLTQEIEREIARTRREEANALARATGYWGALGAIVATIVGGIIMNMQNLAQLIVHSSTK